LSAIKISSENLIVIINDILDLSKIESGKIELESIDFSLAEVMENLYNTLIFKSDEKGLELKMTTDSNIPVLKGDPVRLYQVLMNITANAIKFTEKGSVKVHGRLHRPAAEGLVDKNHDDLRIEFTITD